MTTTTKTKATDLTELRHKIDAVDQRVLDLFRERMALVHEVGELKSASGEKACVIRPGREASMMRKLIKDASDIFPAGAVHSIWRAIIAASTMKELAFTCTVWQPENNNTAYWLTREYFGAETPVSFNINSMPVLHEVSVGKSTVAILPLTQTVKRPWWVEMLSFTDKLQIFALLPFVGKLPFVVDPVLAVGPVCPEKTASDTTLIVITDNKSISRESVHQNFLKLGVKVEEWQKFEEGVGSNCTRFQLFKVEGFHAKDDEIFAKVESALNAVNSTDVKVQLNVLGAFANPITKA